MSEEKFVFKKGVHDTIRSIFVQRDKKDVESILACLLRREDGKGLKFSVGNRYKVAIRHEARGLADGSMDDGVRIEIVDHDRVESCFISMTGNAFVNVILQNLFADVSKDDKEALDGMLMPPRGAAVYYGFGRGREEKDENEDLQEEKRV